MEGFENNQFNMVYVAKRSDEEIRLREALIKNNEAYQKYRYDMNKTLILECKKERKNLKLKLNKIIISKRTELKMN